MTRGLWTPGHLWITPFMSPHELPFRTRSTFGNQVRHDKIGRGGPGRDFPAGALPWADRSDSRRPPASDQTGPTN
jgi:hypothetical protein